MAASKKTPKKSKNSIYRNPNFDVKDAIAKKFGKKAYKTMAQTLSRGYDTIPTSSPRLNLALGIGGFARGRIYEVAGDPGSGKSTLCQDLAANAQLLGLRVGYIDAEHKLDMIWAEKIGVDTETMDYHQPDSAEEALEIVDMLCRSNSADVIIVDSVAALTPEAELNEENIADSHMALQARAMSKFLRKITASVAKFNVCLIFVNQFRDGINTGKKTTGGNALPYYADVRLKLHPIKSGWITEGDTTVGTTCGVDVQKNKMGAPKTTAQFYINFEEGGIERSRELVEDAIEAKVMYTTGQSFIYLPDGCEDPEDGVVLATNGKTSAVAGLREMEDAMDEIDDRLQVFTEQKRQAKKDSRAERRESARARAKEQQEKRAERRRKLAEKAGLAPAPEKAAKKVAKKVAKKTTKKTTASKKAAKKTTKKTTAKKVAKKVAKKTTAAKGGE